MKCQPPAARPGLIGRPSRARVPVRIPIPAEIPALLPLRVLEFPTSELAAVMAHFLSTRTQFGTAWTYLARRFVFTEAPAHVTDQVVLPTLGPSEAQSRDLCSFAVEPGEGLYDVACERLRADGFRLSTETPLDPRGPFEAAICGEGSRDVLAYGTGLTFADALADAIIELEVHRAHRRKPHA